MIYVLLGKSGAGKDTLCNVVSKKMNIPRLVVTTDRPMRENEEQFSPYYFVQKGYFEDRIGNEQDDFICYYKSDNGWYYGVELEYNPSIFKRNLICSNLNPEQYHLLLNNLGENYVTGIFVHSNDKDRLLRCLNREYNCDVYEICRRYLADERDFSKEEHSHLLWHVENIENNVNFAVSQIELIISMTAKPVFERSISSQIEDLEKGDVC